MTKLNINKIIEEIAEKFHEELMNLGYIEGGHNGPYNHEETPVRNTSHWILTFSYLYKTTKNRKFYNAVRKCANYLLSNEARPMNAAFHCRKNRSADFSNGLIGQAWAIEGLVEAYKITNDSQYINCALDVFHLHPFSPIDGLWKIVNVDGSIKGFDMTFNHQLWFAAAGTELFKVTYDEKIFNELNVFFERITQNLEFYKNGLIRHLIEPKKTLYNKMKYFGKKIYNQKLNILDKKTMKYKEIGYHCFNLYAFAIIKNNGFQLQLFDSNKFTNSIKYMLSGEYIKGLLDTHHEKDIVMPKLLTKVNVNRYGYAYNAPGFEVPYIILTFKDKINDQNIDEIINYFITKQFQYTFDSSLNTFSKNTEDPKTLTSRIYEITRYLNYS